MKKIKEIKRKQNRIILIIIAACVLIAAAVAALIIFMPGITETPAITMDDLDMSEANLSDYMITGNETDHVIINVSYTNKNGEAKQGELLVRLYDEVAPATVANFQRLVKKSVYSGSTFHRVVKDFMIQGGQYNVEGADPLTPITGEFTTNGFTNNLLHKRGVISMARNGMNPNSATSEFFIVHKDTSSLDGKYAAFGYVVAGMDIVDEIAETEVTVNAAMQNEVSAPVNTVTINSIQFAMYIGD